MANENLLMLVALFPVSSALPDAVGISTTTITNDEVSVCTYMSFLSQSLLHIHQQVTQSATTKTVFGYDDFVTTVDNTVMVFTSDAEGKNHRNDEKSTNLFQEGQQEAL